MGKHNIIAGLLIDISTWKFPFPVVYVRFKTSKGSIYRQENCHARS